MKEEWLIKLFFLTYTVSEMVSYIPQIVKMVRTKKAEDLSLGSWAIWLTGSLSYLGYVCMTNPDAGLIIMSVLDVSCCMTVFLLTFLYQAKDQI